jgi:hypothetical protein
MPAYFYAARRGDDDRVARTGQTLRAASLPAAAVAPSAITWLDTPTEAPTCGPGFVTYRLAAMVPAISLPVWLTLSSWHSAILRPTRLLAAVVTRRSSLAATPIPVVPLVSVMFTSWRSGKRLPLVLSAPTVSGHCCEADAAALLAAAVELRWIRAPALRSVVPPGYEDIKVLHDAFVTGVHI